MNRKNKLLLTSATAFALVMGMQTIPTYANSEVVTTEVQEDLIAKFNDYYYRAESRDLINWDKVFTLEDILENADVFFNLDEIMANLSDEQKLNLDNEKLETVKYLLEKKYSVLDYWEPKMKDNYFYDEQGLTEGDSPGRFYIKDSEVDDVLDTIKLVEKYDNTDAINIIEQKIGEHTVEDLLSIYKPVAEALKVASEDDKKIALAAAEEFSALFGYEMEEQYDNITSQIDASYNKLSNLTEAQKKLVPMIKVGDMYMMAVEREEYTLNHLVAELPSKATNDNKDRIIEVYEYYMASTKKALLSPTNKSKLENLIKQVDLLNKKPVEKQPIVKQPANKIIKKGNKTTYQKLVNKKYVTTKTVVKKGATTTTTAYKLISGKNKTTNVTTKTKYKKKTVTTYQNKITYYKNAKVKQNIKLYKDKKTNKYTKKDKVKYRSNSKKQQQITLKYAKGKVVSRIETVFNKKGEKKTNKNGKAYQYKTTYKKGKAKKTTRYQFNKKAKLTKAKKVKIRKAF